MFRRSVVAAAALAMGLAPCAASRAFAQERPLASLIDFAAAATVTNTPALAPGPVDPNTIPMSFAPKPSKGISAALNSLYASTALMQALDLHSTITALDRGAVEANPMLGGITQNRPAFMAVKAGIAASSIMAARQMAKHNKLAAVITMVGINSAYALVVSHNYAVARSLR